MNIFESVVKKLTLWYVGALFLVCLVFSIPTYVVASDRLERGAAKQTQIIQEVGPFGNLSPRFTVLRDQQLNRDRQQLLRAIVVANIIVLSLGAYFSYRFAQRTMKPIEEAHEAQARFTTDASHELRTPLATMQAEIEVALRDKKFNVSHAKEVLHSNLEEIARLRILSEQLLNLTRLDNGNLKKTPVDLSKLIQDELPQLQKQATVDAKIAKGIAVTADRQLLQQLLTILTDNAVRYAGSKPPHMELNLAKKDSAAVLTVSDHGIGIKASELPHIFDRFYRGTNAAQQNGSGHGLGLAIAKQIVDAHGGIIAADSKLDESTTFTITLPTSA